MTDLRWHVRAASDATLNVLAPSRLTCGYRVGPIKKHHGAETNVPRRHSGRRGELIDRAYHRGDKTGSHPHGDIMRVSPRCAAKAQITDAARQEWTTSRQFGSRGHG